MCKISLPIDVIIPQKVSNDILTSMESQKCTILILLDLSAAFDTVDHPILLKRLEHHFGINNGALKWIKSYLADRTQSVIISGTQSHVKTLDCNVPQGSVFGPGLYLDFTAPLDEVIGDEIESDFYADDNQLHDDFDPNSPEDTASTIQKLEDSAVRVEEWMNSNMLKLNSDKTEVIIIGSPKHLSKVNIPSIKIGECNIKPSKCVRNIGAYYDENLSMVTHIDHMCASAWYHLGRIRQIRKFLTEEATIIIIHAFITSKLDYLNILLYGLPDLQIQRLQRVQNCAARTIKMGRKYDHVTPLLKDLHWLPVRDRIKFKLLLLTFKCLNGLAPKYLSRLLSYRTTSRKTRSSDKYLLNIPFTKYKTFADRSFAVAAPKEWNSLPLHIRRITELNTFKKTLKTYLFSLAY